MDTSIKKSRKKKQIKKKVEKEKDEQPPNYDMQMIDVGTTLKDEQIPDYEETIRDILEAYEVKVTNRTTNSEGLDLVHFTCTGDLGRIAITRIRSRCTPFHLMWKEDAMLNGYFD